MKIKQEEVPELIKFLGLEEVESLEQAKEKFQSNYVTSEEHASKIGKITGSIANVSRKIFEPFGVTATDEDFKEKKVEDALRALSEKAASTYTSQIEELKKRAEGTGSDDLIKEWENKYTTLEKKYKEVDSLRTEAINQFEQFKTEVQTKEKQGKIMSEFEKALNEAKIAPDVDKYKLKGFKAEFNDKYQIDLEDDNVVIKDKKTGEKLKSDKKAGTFMSINDVVLKEATEAGILQKSPKAGSPTTRKPGQPIIPEMPKAKSNVSPRFMGV